MSNVSRFMAVALGGLALFCGATRAHADTYTCTCQAESCGNGAMPGAQGKVYRDVPESGLERMFGPARSGDGKTGWSCQSQEHPETATPVAAPAPGPRYSCTCSKSECYGLGVMEGKQGQKTEGLSRGQVQANYVPEGSSAAETGWRCSDESGAAYAPIAAPPPVRRAPVFTTAAAPSVRTREEAGAEDRPEGERREYRGFLLGANLGFGPTLGIGEDGFGGLIGMRGGLEIGYKFRSVSLTFGLEITGADASGSSAGSSGRITGLIAAPGLQVVLWRSADERLEVLGGLRFGFGGIVVSPGGSNTNLLFSYEIAPGARYFLHRHFAILGSAGYGGLYQLEKRTSTSVAAGIHNAVATVAIQVVL